MAMYVKDFVQNCLHCVATIPKDKFPKPAGYADTRNQVQRDPALFYFLYVGLSRVGKYQYLPLIKNYLRGYLWLVPCRTADSAATVDALMRWFAVFGVMLL
jgi:hypothetical protein